MDNGEARKNGAKEGLAATFQRQCSIPNGSTDGSASDQVDDGDSDHSVGTPKETFNEHTHSRYGRKRPLPHYETLDTNHIREEDETYKPPRDRRAEAKRSKEKGADGRGSRESARLRTVTPDIRPNGSAKSSARSSVAGNFRDPGRPRLDSAQDAHIEVDLRADLFDPSPDFDPGREVLDEDMMVVGPPDKGVRRHGSQSQGDPKSPLDPEAQDQQRMLVDEQDGDEPRDGEPDDSESHISGGEQVTDEEGYEDEEEYYTDEEEEEEPTGPPLIDPEQMMTLGNFHQRVIPPDMIRRKYGNWENYTKWTYYVPPPDDLKPYDPAEPSMEVCMESIDMTPKEPREFYRFIKITLRSMSDGNVTLTLKPTEDSKTEVCFVKELEAFETIFRVAKKCDIEELCLDFLGVDTSKYVDWLINGSQAHGPLPIQYLDWWNCKQMGFPDGDRGVTFNRLLNHCDPQVLRRLGVHSEKWSYMLLREIREEKPQWRQLVELKVSERLPCPVEKCLHMNNFEIAVPSVGVAEYDEIIEEFQKKLPIHPTPSFDIVTETATTIHLIDEKNPLRLPLYVYEPMHMCSDYMLVVKFEEKRISGRVIPRPSQNWKLPREFLRAFGDEQEAAGRSSCCELDAP